MNSFRSNDDSFRRFDSVACQPSANCVLRVRGLQAAMRCQRVYALCVGAWPMWLIRDPQLSGRLRIVLRVVLCHPELACPSSDEMIRLSSKRSEAYVGFRVLGARSFSLPSFWPWHEPPDAVLLHDIL